MPFSDWSTILKAVGWKLKDTNRKLNAVSYKLKTVHLKLFAVIGVLEHFKRSVQSVQKFKPVGCTLRSLYSVYSVKTRLYKLYTQAALSKANFYFKVEPRLRGLEEDS
jgi:hypothetical protein